MVDFVRAAATAKRNIEKNGRFVTLVKASRTPGNAAQPWRGPASPEVPADQLGPVKMAFIPPSGNDLGRRFTDDEGQLTRTISQVGLLAADSVEALDAAAEVGTYDSITDGGRAWKILEVEELKPAEKTVLYVLRLSA